MAGGPDGGSAQPGAGPTVSTRFGDRLGVAPCACATVTGSTSAAMVQQHASADAIERNQTRIISAYRNGGRGTDTLGRGGQDGGAGTNAHDQASAAHECHLLI